MHPGTILGNASGLFGCTGKARIISRHIRIPRLSPRPSMQNHVHLRRIERRNQRESPSVEIFSKPRVTSVDHHYDGRPFGARSSLFRTVDFFARRVGGIDSISEGHWTIDFRHSIFAHLQRNSENHDIPHIGSWTMKAIVVTDKAAGTAGMKLTKRPEPQAAINDVVVQVHASGFTWDELSWPSTWTDRLGRDRTPVIPGQELAGVVTALGYGTTGLSVGQRVFGLSDSYRGGTLAEYVAVEARNLAPLPGDVDFTVGASVAMPGLTAWQGLFEHGQLHAGQSVLAHGAAGAVGSMVTQLAREAGAYVVGTGRAAHRQTALDFGAQEFVDLDSDALEAVGAAILVFAA